MKANWLLEDLAALGLKYEIFALGKLSKSVRVCATYIVYIPASDSFYFGSSKHFWARRNTHSYSLKKDRHESKKLQKVYNEVEDKELVFIYIPTVDLESATNLEQSLVDRYWGDPRLLNAAKDVRNTGKGVIYSEERLKKMSKITTTFFEDRKNRERAAELSKAMWVNPELREKFLAKALPCLRLGVKATSVAICADGLLYPSISAAARAHDIDHTVALHRLKSKNFSTWFRNENDLNDSSEIKMIEHTPSHTDNSSTGVEAPEVVKQGNNPKGIVFYTDGSARPSNPGNVGWGCHGYYFEMVPPTKGAGHATLVPSRTGYLEKNKKLPLEQQVTILKYFDFYGTNRDIGSNNLAELDAVLNSLRKAQDFEVSEITIHTDSEYVRRTLDEKIPTMKARGWRKPDGQPYANGDSWRQLVDIIEKLEQKEVNINIFYVEGHSGDFGNDKADKLATVAALSAISGLHQQSYAVAEPQGYWKSTVERHPFINNKALYFNTISRGHIPGEYYTGNHDKDIQLLGRRDPNSAFGVVMLKDPSPVIELLRKYVTQCAEEIDSLVVTRFDRLFNPAVYEELLEYGPVALVRTSPYSLDFKGLDREPITEEVRPLRIGYRAIQEVSKLKKILLDVRAGNDNLFVKEITDVFYDTEMKKSKVKDGEPTKVSKLKSTFGVGVDKVRVKAIVPDTDKEMEITLNLGSDLIDRNALRQLEEYSPQIFVVTWADSEGAIRFATVGKAGDSWAIWAGAYSNIIFKQPTEVKDVQTV